MKDTRARRGGKEERNGKGRGTEGGVGHIPQQYITDSTTLFTPFIGLH